MQILYIIFAKVLDWCNAVVCCKISYIEHVQNGQIQIILHMRKLSLGPLLTHIHSVVSNDYGSGVKFDQTARTFGVRIYPKTRFPRHSAASVMVSLRYIN